MADDEAPGLVPVPCIQCGRPPVVAFEVTRGNFVNLCMDHFQQAQAMRNREIQLYGQLAETAEDQIADVMGFPRKVRPARVNVNQVNIAGDNLGVVNTGTVGNIQNSVSIIHGQNAALAEQLTALTNAIIASTALDDAQKREAVDLMGEVAADIAKPGRSRAAMKAIATGLSQVLSHSADLYTLWEAVTPHLPR